MKKTLTALALVIGLVLPLFGFAQTAELDAAVDRMLRGAKVTGGSVVVTLRGEVAYTRDYGFLNKREQTPVDEHTYFKVASITKMVSGMGLMTLKERGMVDLDEDISSYLGVQIRNPRFSRVPITLRQLMSHTAGISDTGGYSNLRNSLTDMLAYANKRRANFSDFEPGTRYKYSNFGAGIVGAIMEAVTGESVNAYVTRAVFDPLGIDAAYAARYLDHPENVTSMYTPAGTMDKSASLYLKEEYEDFADPETHFRTTIGSLWIKSRDLARLTALLCELGSLDGVRLLQEDTVLEMMAEQKDLGKSVKGESSYGLHLENHDDIIDGVMFYGHQGIGNNSIVNTYFDPVSGFTFTLLVNSSTKTQDHRVGALARRLINELYPRFAGKTAP